MGVGGYLAAKAEQDTFRHRYTEITNRLSVACDSELDREVHDILGPLGLQENVSRVVSRALAQAQRATEDGDDRSFTSSHLAHQRSLFGRLGLTQRPVPKEGTAAFLLKLGEGMEEVPSSRLFLSAVTIGLSYAIGGILPIIPYFFIPVAYDALKWSIVSLTTQGSIPCEHRLADMSRSRIDSSERVSSWSSSELSNRGSPELPSVPSV
jgi:VIT1/CCC1 family predicted Fe2+/Mn2+ transporter